MAPPAFSWTPWAFARAGRLEEREEEERKDGGGTMKEGGEKGIVTVNPLLEEFTPFLPGREGHRLLKG